ncbi:MAG: 2-oxo acid dehydrogenase subunit E2 [Desulfomonilia bacterium]
MMKTRKARFSRVKQVPSFFKLAAAWWKPIEEPFIFNSVSIDMTNALALMESQFRQTGEKITITHLCTKALATAYKKFPHINMKVEGNKVYRRNTVDIMVLVSSQSGEELSGIKLCDADNKTLPDIAREIREGAIAVRADRGPTYQFSQDLIKYLPITLVKWVLKVSDILVNRFNIDLSLLGFPDDPFGAAIISSVGMFGIEEVYGPLVPVARCGLLLLITEIMDKPWAQDGHVVVKPVLKLCMTLDHRIFHGYYLSQFQKEMKELLGHPELLLCKENTIDIGIRREGCEALSAGHGLKAGVM